MFRLDSISQKVDVLIMLADIKGSLNRIREKDKINISLCSLLLV